MSLIPNNAPNNLGNKRYESLVWLIIGQPMTGKSSFANSFPNPLLINTDGNYFQFDTPVIFLDKTGVDAIGADGKPNGQKYNSWVYLKNVINELVADPYTKGYKTLILDLVEDLYEFCRLYVIGVHKKKHESEIGGYGQGYKLVEDEFITVMSQAAKLREFGWNVIMLSHEKIENIKTVDEKVVETQYGATLRAKVQNKLKGISHVTGRTGKIIRVENTSVGPVKKQDFILHINEHQSIASNRMNLPFDQIYLSYAGWQNALASLNKVSEPAKAVEGEQNVNNIQK